MPDGAVTANPNHHLQRQATLWRRWLDRKRIAGRCWEMSLTFAAVLQHSTPQEILNEHQSKGNRGEQARTLIIPQREAPERWVAVRKASGVTWMDKEWDSNRSLSCPVEDSRFDKAEPCHRACCHNPVVSQHKLPQGSTGQLLLTG